MPTEVRHLVESGQSYPIVRLLGVLDADSAGHVRAALLTALAEQPEALVVDVCDLTVADPEAMSVLSEVARETADWPGARLILCAPDDAKGWRRLEFPVWPSRAEAMQALGPADPSHRSSLELQPVMGAARRAREVVTEACGWWEVPHLAGPASIVVTEMVNNVVAHVRTPMAVLLALRDGDLTVAVRDGSRTTPRFTGPVAPTSYGGRGLLLIDSVARRWGSLALADGKVVWAILDPEETSNLG